MNFKSTRSFISDLGNIVGKAGKEIGTEMFANMTAEQLEQYLSKLRDSRGASTTDSAALRAYESLKTSSAWLSKKDEAAFIRLIGLCSHHLIFDSLLAPHHSRKLIDDTLQFLQNVARSEKWKLDGYRQILITIPDLETRMISFTHLVNAETNDERQRIIDMAVPSKPRVLKTWEKMITVAQNIPEYKKKGDEAIKKTLLDIIK